MTDAARGAKQEITCKCGCGRKRLVRVADVKRGWGKFFDKSCKAKWQESRTHATRDYHRRAERREREEEDGPTFCDAHLFSNEEHDCNKDLV